MVLTVTINPLLERRITLNEITLSEVNRGLKKVYKAGGKGINVSRQLNNLKIKNHALIFLGGNSGKILRQILINEKINFSVVTTKNETRSATLIIENNTKNITSFFEPDVELKMNEIDDLKNKLEKMIQNCSIVVFSGSSPSELSDNIFPYGITLANKFDK
ncbi:PfkB family carbohydrate kinase, partial [Bacteroidota bacterium]